MQNQPEEIIHIPTLTTGTGKFATSVTTATVQWPSTGSVRGFVIFAHGSGSSRFSPRNQAVAAWLQRYGLATVLLDLLTPSEEHKDSLTAEYRFDIPLLAERLMLARLFCGMRYQNVQGAAKWGYFGASTGAAAALIAAAPSAQQKFVSGLSADARQLLQKAAVTGQSVGREMIQTSADQVQLDMHNDQSLIEIGLHMDAVVSRGGRVDLASSVLADPGLPPCLVLVGSMDHWVLQATKEAMNKMKTERKLQVVAGATHLFEERGKLHEVAEATAQFFVKEFAS